MGQSLQLSLVLSVVGTIALNVAIRLAAARSSRRTPATSAEVRQLPPATPSEPPADRRARTRVWVPWKFMIIASLGLTLALNILPAVFRTLFGG